MSSCDDAKPHIVLEDVTLDLIQEDGSLDWVIDG